MDATRKKCCQENCPNVAIKRSSRQLCYRHYEAWRKDPGNDSLKRPSPGKTLLEAFERIQPLVVDETGCVEWRGHMSGRGKQYGDLYFSGKRIKAHRAAYQIVHGQIPDGRLVDHICHNTACVNPAHLRLASVKQNAENRASSASSTGVRGVTYDANRRLYRARVKHNYSEVHVGRYDTLEDAAQAVRAKRIELFTHSIEQVR